MATPYDSQAAALDRFLDRFPETVGEGGPVHVFRALPGPYLRRFAGRSIHCRQTHRPEAEALARLGFDPGAEPETPAALCMVFATKYKEETLYHFARAASLLEEGGMLVASVANELGAPSLERRCAELLGHVDTYSKHKCRVFRGRKDSARLNPDLAEAWLRFGEYRTIPGTDLVARPGMFSWKAIDPGSRLLAGHLPDDLAGRGADLGAGYGYLSRALLARAPRITELHLFEAERKALDAAERNLSAHRGGAAMHYHWADATAGLPVGRLDFVVMNPPFHSGRGKDLGLGKTFVRTALAALNPGGRLCLVANRHLPYETEIEAYGAMIDARIEAEGFKVITARRLDC